MPDQTDPAEAAQRWIAQATAAVRKGRTGEAALCLRHATTLLPQAAGPWRMLGDVLLHRGTLDPAVDAYRKALAIEPDPQIQLKLGTALASLDRLDEAVEAMQLAVELAPGWGEARRGLASTLSSSGQVDRAVEQLRAALTLDPTNDTGHSLLLYATLFQGTTPAAEIRALHEQWAAQHTAAVMRLSPPPNDRTPDRRLRVGYVSPNFYNQAVSHFLPPIFEHHDPWHVEIFCYSDVARPDATTARLRAGVDTWRETAPLSHEQLARLIRDDRIDILLDLTGHIGGGRLLTFAAKPAPVQITYMGYQATTGVKEIDYVLTDAWTDPPGRTESFWVEQPWRLPGAFFCYEPQRLVAPAVAPLPALSCGHITFGCLNNIVKLTPRTFDLWCRVLREVTDARFMLLAPAGEQTRDRLRHQFEHRGVSGDRLDWVGRASVRDYLDRFNRIDLALDPVPFQGHSTTCDAAWMGVPTVSLAGDCYAYRYGSGIMRNLGWSELVTTTEDAYVATAIALAHDLPRLAAMRNVLRPRMETSIMTDGRQFTRNLEAAFREMWAIWCRS